MKISYAQFLFEAHTVKQEGVTYITPQRPLNYDEALDQYGGPETIDHFNGDATAFERHRLKNVLKHFDPVTPGRDIRNKFEQAARAGDPHASLVMHLVKNAPPERIMSRKNRTFLDKLSIYAKGLHGGDLHADLRAAADLHGISDYQLPATEAMRGLFNTSIPQVRDSKFPYDFDDHIGLSSVEFRKANKEYGKQYYKEKVKPKS